MSSKTAVVNTEAFRHLIMSQQGRRKAKRLLDFQTRNQFGTPGGEKSFLRGCWVAIEITRRDHSTATRVRCLYILSRDPYLSFVVPEIACDGTRTITSATYENVNTNEKVHLANFVGCTPDHC